MKYSEVRATAQSGDVLLLKGKGAISRFIRGWSGGSMSHCAMLHNMFEGRALIVTEVKEGTGLSLLFGGGGWRMDRASNYIEDFVNNEKYDIYFGKAKTFITDYEEDINKEAFTRRDTRYSIKAAWLAGIGGKKQNKTKGADACSSYIQEVWEAGRGVKYNEVFNPSSLVDELQYMSKITSLD